jgi:hypothetical protein
MTDRERAEYHLSRRRGNRRPAAEPQSDGLFAEPDRQMRRWLPLGRQGHDEGLALFAEPGSRERRLVTIDGWPDYRAAGLA